MRVPLHPCYFLHLRPYRETSLIADVLSRDYGRVTLVARGARRRSRRATGIFQPLCPLQIAWTLRGEMGTLTGIEPGGAAHQMSGPWLLSAMYINELLVRLLHGHDPQPELFPAYEQTLTRLAQRQPEEPVLRLFEKRLLISLGYGLVLDHDCRTGSAIDPGSGYFYCPDRGPSRVPSGSHQDVPISGAALLALHGESLTDAVHVQECKRLMRVLLGVHLGVRPLASRRLYRQLLAGSAPMRRE
ncbi:MAG: DNA repair protein RecO [Gammaproteobacteria bacterium]|nr:DNA repair protein RecO [Gammaproteobacteria bacterium]